MRNIIAVLCLVLFQSCGFFQEKDNKVIPNEVEYDFIKKNDTSKVIDSEQYIEKFDTVSNEQWRELRVDSVKFYLYNLKENLQSLIIEKGRVNNSVVKKEGQKLNSKQLLEFNRIMAVDNKEINAPECFIPHYGFVAYRNGDIAGHVSVCSICDNVHSFPNSNKQAIVFKSLVLSLGHNWKKI